MKERFFDWLFDDDRAFILQIIVFIPIALVIGLGSAINPRLGEWWDLELELAAIRAIGVIRKNH